MNTPRRPEELLALVSTRLASLPYRVVFVGGATTSLFITDLAAAGVRSTTDVDVIVDVRSYSDYVGSLRDALLELGAREDTSEDAPLCRWILAGIPVDVMTPDERVLLFSNRWYASALENSHPHELPNGTTIFLPTSCLFVATKIEAFRGRGNGDFLSSKDMEDIVTILDGRPEFFEEVKAAEPTLRQYLQQTLEEWLGHRDFEYAVQGHLPGGIEGQDRVDVILERIRDIVNLGGTPA